MKLYSKPETTIVEEVLSFSVICTSPNAFVEGGGGNYSDDAIHDNGSY